MSEIQMTGEIRTDYDCEAIGFPAEKWGKQYSRLEKKRLFLKSVWKMTLLSP
jgi:hypothetical protein